MGNRANRIKEVKNLREWLDFQLGDENKYLYRTLENGEKEKCYNADLIWDGTNYHVTYTNEDETESYIFPFTYTDQIVWTIA